MKKLSKIRFQDFEFDIVDHEGKRWLTGGQIDLALGYSKNQGGVRRIYNRNKDEFTDEMTMVINLAGQIDPSGQARPTRIFSPRGCHLLGMFAKTKKAAEFRIWVLDVLEKHLQYKTPQLKLWTAKEWLQKRSEIKITRRIETDVIQTFTIYATNQGSQNANRYFVAISKMVNNTLFVNLFFLLKALPKKTNLRNLMDILQLKQAEMADIIVAKTLKEGMSNGLFYKNIYQLAKKRVETFATVAGKTPLLPDAKQEDTLRNLNEGDYANSMYVGRRT